MSILRQGSLRFFERKVSMPLNVCQTQKIVEADITSLCSDCLSRPGCVKASMHELLSLTTVPANEHKLSIITECDTYKPSNERPAFKASLWPNLIHAGVKNNCNSCPNEEMKKCDYHHALVSLTVTAKRGGEVLEATVFCCGDVSPLHRIHQIAEPSGD